jgi:hypothetical protein
MAKAAKVAERFESARDSARNRLSRDISQTVVARSRRFGPNADGSTYPNVNPLITKLVGLIGEQVRGNLAANAGGTTW